MLLIFKWPFKELIQVAGFVLLAYGARKHMAKNYLKYLAAYENRLADEEERNFHDDKPSKLIDVKQQLFRQMYDKMRGKQCNVLEIGIGCGNSFFYYQPGLLWSSSFWVSQFWYRSDFSIWIFDFILYRYNCDRFGSERILRAIRMETCDQQ